MLDTGIDRKPQYLLHCIFIYTAFWAVGAAVIGILFRVNGKSFLWTVDGVPQHFVAFNYVCEYVEDLLLHHRFRGFFNYSLGQGMDILQTLNSYDFTDPVSAVAALFFPLSRVQRYTMMIFLKLYLVGLSYLLFCRATERTDRAAVLAGAIAYMFSGAVLFTLARHPNYINWAYFFPFLLSGAEFYRRQGKRIPLVLFVALNVITSYYTFYMNTVLVAIYLLTGSICRWCKNRTAAVAKKEWGVLLRTALVYTVGIALSAVVLLPSIDAFLNNYRVGFASGYTESLLHYEWRYYLKLPESLFTMNYEAGDYYTDLGFNAASFLPLILLFLRRGKQTELKALLTLSLLMLCVPLAGRILNGFGYASNRWSYAVLFYVSVAITDLACELPEMTRQEKKKSVVVFVVYLAVCIGSCFLHDNRQTRTIVLSALVLLLCVNVLLFLRLAGGKRQESDGRWGRGFLGLVALSSMLQVCLYYMPAAGGAVKEYLNRAETESVFQDYSSVAVKEISGGFFRTDEEDQEITTKENHDGYHNVNGTSFYWSMYPVWVYDYYRELGLSSVLQNCRPAGLSGRTGLLELASVRYYTKPASDTGGVPYGYREISSPDPAYQVYENQFALPVAYTYSSWMTEEEYAALDGIEKEQALLQAAVLTKEPDSENVSRCVPDQAAILLEYEITHTEDVRLTEGHLSTERDGSFTLTVDVPADCELYLYLRNIQLENQPDPLERFIAGDYGIGLAALRETGRETVERSAQISNRNYCWPVLRDDVAFNLGCGVAGESTIRVTVGRKAEFSVDEIAVIAVPMSAYVDYAERLWEHVLEHVEVGADRLTGTITVPDSRILQFSVPYSKGWTAYVDGEKTEVLRTDVMYLSVMVPEGEHRVELYYKTPGLRAGLILSVVTAVLWVGFEAAVSRKRTVAVSGFVKT